VGAVATLVEHSETGFIVPPGDAKSIADNIHLLAERADVRRSIGTAARNFAVQHFDIPQMIHGYEMLYESAHDRLHREVSA
jgi:glycosyltransferase involved in cell wall biosynthesis